jgi:GT2 family glycosyltransferase
MSKPIPVIGTAIVNNPYWLHRLFMSIDYPVDNFVVFNNNGRGQITEEVEAVKSLVNPFVRKVHVTHMPANIGCSGAWNLIIKSFMKAPYWVISNHDVMFEPGFLGEMSSKAEDEEVGIVHGSGGGWDIFLLKDWMVQKYGLFDENLYPGYCEDMDYGMRFIHDDVKRVLSLEHGYYHGTKKDYSDGSQTWRSEPRLQNAVHVAHEMNKRYLHAKWSEAWQAHVEGETYKTPFNIPELPNSFTTWDLEFCRHKNLGF